MVHAGYLLRRWRLTALADAGQEDAAGADAKAGMHLSQTFDGMWVLDGTCDPESGAILKRAIDEEVDALFRRGDATIDDGLTPAKRRMAALVELVRRGSHTATSEPDEAGDVGNADADIAPGPLALDEVTPAENAAAGDIVLGARAQADASETGDSAGRTPTSTSDEAPQPPAPATSTAAAGRPTVILQIDAHTAGREPVRTSRDFEFRANDCDGTGPVSYLTIDRLLCDADVIPVIVDGAGEVLDVGRSRRFPTPAQRRALCVRDTGCVFPGCNVNLSRCDAHHVVPWEWDGPTDLANLVLLCRYHHHCVHEGGFVLTRGLDHLVRVWRPDGTALPLGHHGTQLADDEPRPAPHPLETGEPPDVAAARKQLRHPPPPPLGPPRFLEPAEQTRRRYLTDVRNCGHQSVEMATFTLSSLEIQRGRVRFPHPPDDWRTRPSPQRR